MVAQVCYMAQYMPPKLRDEISENNPGVEIRVALVLAEDASEDRIHRRADDHDGVSIERTLPSGVVLATCTVGTAMEFLSTEDIASASLTDRAEVMG